MSEENNNPKDNKDNNNINIDVQDVIADSQAEITSLKKEIEDLKVQLRSAERESEKFKSEADRENKKGKIAIDEKKDMLEKVKHYQDMHEGIEDEVAREVLKRARDGDGADFETEKQRIMESAINDFKENHYNALLDENQELKDKNNVFKEKLHNSVVIGAITKNALKFGVKPSLAPYVVSDFNDRMKVDEKGELVFLNKDGYPTNSFDWKSAFLMLKQDKPDLFHKSTGSKSNSSVDSDPLGDVNVNPWKKETRNRGLQVKILQEDKERANKLRKEAGLVPV